MAFAVWTEVGSPSSLGELVLSVWSRRAGPGPRRTGRPRRPRPGSGSRPGRRSAPAPTGRPLDQQSPATARGPRCRTSRPSGRPASPASSSSSRCGVGRTGGGQRQQAGRPAARLTRRRLQAGHHVEVEQAAGAGPDRLAVVRVHRAAGEQHRVGPGCVGGAQDGAGVARVVGFDQHRQQPRARRPALGQRGRRTGADGDQALRRDRLADSAAAASVADHVSPAPGQQSGVRLDRLGGGEQLEHCVRPATAPRERPGRPRQETARPRGGPAAGEPPGRREPGVGVRAEQVRQRRASERRRRRCPRPRRPAWPPRPARRRPARR